jgi:energy-coupling factor transporter ATP-binding protein EcfA2
MNKEPLPGQKFAAKGPLNELVALLASPRGRWAYYVLVSFFATGVAVTLAGGVTSVTQYLNSRQGFWPSVGWFMGLIWLLSGLMFFSQERRNLLNRETVGVSRLGEDDVKRIDELTLAREQQAREEFERNLGAVLTVRQFEARDVVLFHDITWNLQPGVNVLLGRNGYGKSLVLRALAGTLQHDRGVTASLVGDGRDPEEEKIRVRLLRDGEIVFIARDARRFTDSVGKVPLLAIPDSRFFDRSQAAIGSSEHDTTDLLEAGAHHFLNQLPYGSIIQDLFVEICLDYWEHGRSFDLPVFTFFRQCVKQLTDYEFNFVSIERRGRTNFDVKVKTEGNDSPLPIQYASQGTLSLIAMLGIIRSYVRTLSPKGEQRDGVQTGSAIVLIDEADAHLHPLWQQKFPTLLRNFFPNVQFILSAHSPLFVAGCWNGEVAILRRYTPEEGKGFRIEQPNKDFVGAKPADLYEQIFEIEKPDDNYLKYLTKASQASLRQKLTSDREKLSREQEQDPQGLPPAQAEELSNIVEEERRIEVASELKEERRGEIATEVRITQLEARICELEAELATKSQDERLAESAG